MIIPAREVDDLDVLDGVHVSVLRLLEEVSDVLRNGLEVERELRRRDEVFTVGVVTWNFYDGS